MRETRSEKENGRHFCRPFPFGENFFTQCLRWSWSEGALYQHRQSAQALIKSEIAAFCGRMVQVS
jgi:hypothetical protein